MRRAACPPTPAGSAPALPLLEAWGRIRCLEEETLHKPRNWTAVIERLNASAKGELRIKMGSPGSAQVTRCRLLAEWTNLEATTVGWTLILRLPSAR